MRAVRTSIFAIGLCLLMTCTSAYGAVVDLSASFEQPVFTEGGGRTLLVEEITATGCSTCAEIDPELLRVADSHGSRIALVALHPSTTADAFQPEASKERIERLEITQSGLNQTPTFLVESGAARRGYDAWQDVQRDILNEEVSRQITSKIDVSVVKTERGYRASVAHADLVQINGTQLTMMVVQHGKIVPEGALNVGLDHRDRVLVGMAECSLENNTVIRAIDVQNASVGESCADSFAVEFENYESWSVVLVHESTEEELHEGGRTTTYGVVELAHRDRAEVNPSSSLAGRVLLVSCVMLAVASILRKK